VVDELDQDAEDLDPRGAAPEEDALREEEDPVNPKVGFETSRAGMLPNAVGPSLRPPSPRFRQPREDETRRKLGEVEPLDPAQALWGRVLSCLDGRIRVLIDDPQSGCIEREYPRQLLRPLGGPISEGEPVLVWESEHPAVIYRERDAPWLNARPLSINGKDLAELLRDKPPLTYAESLRLQLRGYGMAEETAERTAEALLSLHSPPEK